jgi:hypothetical protein
MAPKPKASKSKPTGSASKAKDEPTSDPTVDDEASRGPPRTKDDVLAYMTFDDLPNPPKQEIRDIFAGKYDELVRVFAHYCKLSKCETIETSTRMTVGTPRSAARRAGGKPLQAHRRAAALSRAALPLVTRSFPPRSVPSPPPTAAGFKRLMKDTGLELKVYNVDKQCRLFNLVGGAKVGARRRGRSAAHAPHRGHAHTPQRTRRTRRMRRTPRTRRRSPLDMPLDTER